MTTEKRTGIIGDLGMDVLTLLGLKPEDGVSTAEITVGVILTPEIKVCFLGGKGEPDRVAYYGVPLADQEAFALDVLRLTGEDRCTKLVLRCTPPLATFEITKELHYAPSVPQTRSYTRIEMEG